MIVSADEKADLQTKVSTLKTELTDLDGRISELSHEKMSKDDAVILYSLKTKRFNISSEVKTVENQLKHITEKERQEETKRVANKQAEYANVPKAVLGQYVNNGQCYGFTAWYVNQLGGPQLMGSGKIAASDIGTDYDWSKSGWSVGLNPNTSDLKAGDVINWKRSAVYSTSSGYTVDASYGHTAVVKSVNNDGTITIYDQNPNAVTEKTIRLVDNSLSSYVRKNV